MSMTSAGLFMPQIDWADPEFAPWNIANLDLNDAQREALIRSTEDTAVPELTTEQKIELCLTVPCKVELFHSNVCNGVERSWPKRMFNKDNFQLLNPKEQRCIYRDMQRKAVLLHNTYVDAKRLADRRRRRTNRALAPYYELIYRKELFLQIKALDEPAPGEPAPSYDAIIDESLVLTDSEADVSQQTVIHTGNTGTQKSSVDRESVVDSNDNDCSSDVMSENAEPIANDGMQTPNWKSKSTYTITQNFSIHEIADTMDNNIGTIATECSVSSTYNVEMSESVVSSTQDSNSATQSQSNNDNSIVPEVQSNEFVFGTPSINYARHSASKLWVEDEVENESEFDSLDFLSQGMTARTSTQQKEIV